MWVSAAPTEAENKMQRFEVQQILPQPQRIRPSDLHCACGLGQNEKKIDTLQGSNISQTNSSTVADKTENRCAKIISCEKTPRAKIKVFGESSTAVPPLYGRRAVWRSLGTMLGPHRHLPLQASSLPDGNPPPSACYTHLVFCLQS